MTRTALACFVAEPQTPPKLLAPGGVAGSVAHSPYYLYGSLRYSPAPSPALSCGPLMAREYVL